MLQSDAPPCETCGSIQVLREPMPTVWRCLNCGDPTAPTFVVKSVTVKGEPCVVLTPAEAQALGRLVAKASEAWHNSAALRDALAAIPPTLAAKLAPPPGAGGPG